MRFAFVTPRYGAEIGTGPEHACRLLAEALAERHEVEVVTTCARNPTSWKNEYTEGADKVRGVVVRRFAVNQAHDARAFEHLTKRLRHGAHSREDELEWVRRLGPSAPGLIDHLKRHQRQYDTFVFFSLQHATTVHGLDIVPDRTIVFPYLRLDETLRFSLWQALLATPRGVGLISTAERLLLRTFLHVTPLHEELIGVGTEPSPQQTYPQHQRDPADTVSTDEEAGDERAGEATDYLAGRGIPFRRRHRLYGPLALYSGRVEPDNGSEEMLEYFGAYAGANGSTPLVLMGVKMIRVPEQPYIRMAGVLPDRERMIAYEAADVTIAPAADDLIAQPVLESFAVGTPVLASARNLSAVEHCRLANAGLYYETRDEFVEALTLLMSNTRLRERLGENGRQYVTQHYRWEAVLGRFERLATKGRKS